jgi:F0F1-type ATP synthase epsilon subunit
MADAQPQPAQPQPNQTPPPAVIIDPTKIHIMVRNRTMMIFNDDVKAVTSKNDTGVFDVLPEHANFISTIKESITLHKLDGQDIRIPATNGIMKVKDSGIKCYIDLMSPEMNLGKKK